MVLTLFHIIFVAMFVFGISTTRSNSNYRKNVKWIYEDAYEDSAQFDERLTKDAGHIFTYVGYKNMLETNGKLDMHKVIVRVSNGSGEQGTERILGQIVRYIKTRGHYLDGNFQLAGSSISMDDEKEKITADFQSYNPDFVDADVGEAPRMTVEDLALDILVHLSEYYTIYYNYVENDTSLSLRIGYKSDKGDVKVSTNVSNEAMEEIAGTGGCFYVLGDTIRMDTNTAAVPANATTLLEIWSPYKNDKNYMVLSVDTSYPNTDVYSIEAKVYKKARNEFIIGTGSVILGGLGRVVTLAMLMLMSGHIMDGGAEIYLFLIDDTHTEPCLILWAVVTAVLIHTGRYVGIRLFSLFAPNE